MAVLVAAGRGDGAGVGVATGDGVGVTGTRVGVSTTLALTAELVGGAVAVGEDTGGETADVARQPATSARTIK